ncbi:MAG: hypothetical protein L3J07_02425 [Candidatus Magasanikbacteria bacterium]|nr:hypothetical protein [Candidatus Magasanikbacteria bacterium]
MRQKIDSVEIKQPPIGGLRKKPSCIKRGCFMSCGLIVLFLIAILVILKFTTTERPRELKELPEFFPIEIPIYDADNVDTITLQSEHKKNKELELVLMLPKIIVSPIVILKSENKESSWKTFTEFITKPIIPTKENVTIEWFDLSASSDFLQEYYAKEFKKNNFKVLISKDNGNRRQFSFKKEGVSGLFFINDSPKTEGTDYLSLSVKIINTPK